METQRSFGMEMRSLHNLIVRKLSALSGIPEGEHHVTVMHGRVMEFLRINQDKEVFQRDIERNFEIRRPTATRILQSMEKRGLIRRQGVDYDARLKQVTLTERAMEIHEQMDDIHAKFEADSLKGLTEEEINAFFDVMQKIKRNIGEM